MAGYEAFTPEILANELMTDRERKTVFKSLCYKGPIIGEITKKGDKLYIAGVGRPTIGEYTGSVISLETKKAYRQELVIDQSPYINVMVDAVDNAQMQGKVFDKEIQEAKRALAQNLDEFIAGYYDQAGDTVTNAACTSVNITSTLAEAQEALFVGDVGADEEVHIVVSPAVYTKMVLAKIVFQVQNKEMFGKGFKGTYLNFNVHMSNSIQKTGNVHHCMAFTTQAIAVAEQIPASGIRIYDPEQYFGKAFKVLHLFGGTVIRPAELVCIDITTAAEAVV